MGDVRAVRTGHGNASTSRVRTDHTTWMTTSLLLWLCALPVVGILILPALGARVALVVAAVLLVTSMTACFAICAWQAAGPKRSVHDE